MACFVTELRHAREGGRPICFSSRNNENGIFVYARVIAAPTNSARF